MKFRGTNFLEIIHPERAKRRRAALFVKIIFYAFATVVAAAIVLVAIYFGTARKVYGLAESGKQNLESASSDISSLNFQKADADLASAEINFSEAKVSFDKLKFLENFPWVGAQYKAVAGLIETGLDTSSAMRDVVGIASEIMSVTNEAQGVVGGIPTVGGGTSFAEISPEKKREILQKLFDSAPKLTAAKAKIDLALAALEQINESRVVNQISQVLGPAKDTLLKIQSTLETAIPASEILPAIAGYPAEKTYLFLLQNSDELRPTGGFIGTYGIVKVKDGELEVFDTENIYTLDMPAEKFLHVDPPAPIKKYLKVSDWFMRDSNWSPDFPTSAAEAEYFYHAEGGKEQKIDAVIAVTPTFIEDILRQTGNIETGGQTFTPDNLMDVLQYKVEKEYYDKGIPESQRKDIVGQLGQVIFEKLANLPSSAWSGLFSVAKKDLAERHILVWSKDQDLEKIIAENDWGGRVLGTDGDYLMVVDANLASLKTDSVMTRAIDYSISSDSSGKLHAKVTVTYKNNGTFTWKTTRYRTYTRIYVPGGSTLVGGSGMLENDKISDPTRKPGKIDIGEELGKTYFGAFISIEPGAEGTLQLEYILPDNIKSQIAGGMYKLLVQKQSGTLGYPLTLNLVFDKNIKQATPAEEQKDWGDKVYKLRTDLSIDRQIEVGF